MSTRFAFFRDQMAGLHQESANPARCAAPATSTDFANAIVQKRKQFAHAKQMNEIAPYDPWDFHIFTLQLLIHFAIAKIRHCFYLILLELIDHDIRLFIGKASSMGADDSTTNKTIGFGRVA